MNVVHKVALEARKSVAGVPPVELPAAKRMPWLSKKGEALDPKFSVNVELSKYP